MKRSFMLKQKFFFWIYMTFWWIPGVKGLILVREASYLFPPRSFQNFCVKKILKISFSHIFVVPQKVLWSLHKTFWSTRKKCNVNFKFFFASSGIGAERVKNLHVYRAISQWPKNVFNLGDHLVCSQHFPKN